MQNSLCGFSTFLHIKKQKIDYGIFYKKLTKNILQKLKIDIKNIRK